MKRIEQNKDFQKLKKQMKKFQEKEKKQKTITIAEVLEDKDNSIKSRSEAEEPMIGGKTNKKELF